MKKTLKIFLLTLTIVLLAATSALAAQSIEVVTNGSGAFSKGSIVVISGDVTNGDDPQPNTTVSVEVTSPTDVVVFYTDTVTDDDGYYRAIFAMPKSSITGQYTIEASTASASAETDFTITAATKTGPALQGWMPAGLSLTTPTENIAKATDEVVLVFDKNVNYYYSSNSPDYEIGINENNEDCFDVYRMDTNKKVPCNVELLSNNTAGAEDISYYDVSDDITEIAAAKTAIIISFPDGLTAGTTYKIVADGDLCANNGLKMGSDYTVYFKTGDNSSGNNDNSSGISPVGGVILPYDQPAVPAADIGTVTQNGMAATLQVDSHKALDIINNNQLQGLSIDISTLMGTNGTQAGVQLPAEVINAVQQTNNSIVLRNGDLAIVIPPAALPQGQNVELSAARVDEKTLPAAPAQVNRSAVYEFNAWMGNEQTHHFQQALTITLPIPEGISEPEKLGVYCLNETSGQWEYVGGRIIDGKLVVTTNHFSKYMVAESRKTFADISNHWAKGTIEIMAARQIVTGVDATDFAPQRNVTRAEFASLLSRILKLADNAADNTFTDVSADAWYSEDVLKAAGAGLVQGADGKFRPNDMITRQEMAVMAMRAYASAGGQMAENTDLTFTDKEEISPWASEKVKEASNLGIIKGQPDGNFAPLANTTRAEATVVLKILMDKLGL